jgi:hypothetical protein
VELVRREGHPVGAESREIEGAVRRELRGVHHDPRALPSRRGAKLLEGPELAGHVARSGDGEEAVAVARAERGERLFCARHDLAAVARYRQLDMRQRSPRQQVRVVLGGEGDDARLVRKRCREEVQRVGRVPREDYRIVLPPADERADGGASALEEARAHGRRVAGAPVHAAVPGQRRRHGLVCRAQAGRARRAIQVRVADEAAGDQRDEKVSAEDVEREKALGAPLRGAGSDRDGDHARPFSDSSIAGVRACRSHHAAGQVFTRGTPPRTEGCRPASRGFALELLTSEEGSRFGSRDAEAN